MSTKEFPYDYINVPSGKDAIVGIVVAEWNHEITEILLQGAVSTLVKNGVKNDNILIYHVPGTFELSFAAKQIVEYKDIDAVIVLGVVIQGETHHFDFICQSVTQGITSLNTDKDNEIPVIFGVLTTNNKEQAQDRAGGKYGNKGSEAAIAALKMIKFNLDILEV